jgi:hypothetical protein
MLYVNVYLVSQVWFSPAEGGCYYDAGEPIASIPIKTEYQKGRDYYLSDQDVHLRDCYSCHGTGEVDQEAEDWQLQVGEEPYTYKVVCQYCGKIPADVEATDKLMSEMEEMFKDEPGRYQHIRVSLEDHFAQPYPDRVPHYE